MPENGTPRSEPPEISRARFLNTGAAPAAWNMAVDEALFKRCQAHLRSGRAPRKVPLALSRLWVVAPGDLPGAGPGRRARRFSGAPRRGGHRPLPKAHRRARGAARLRTDVFRHRPRGASGRDDRGSLPERQRGAGRGAGLPGGAGRALSPGGERLRLAGLLLRDGLRLGDRGRRPEDGGQRAVQGGRRGPAARQRPCSAPPRSVWRGFSGRGAPGAAALPALTRWVSGRFWARRSRSARSRAPSRRASSAPWASGFGRTRSPKPSARRRGRRPARDTRAARGRWRGESSIRRPGASPRLSANEAPP